MILQGSHHIVDCPVCGRPIEMQLHLLNHELVCGHCRGEFIVHKADDGSLATTNLRGTDPLKRAEQLLRVPCETDLPAAESPYRIRFSLVSDQNEKTHRDDSLSTLTEDEVCEETLLPTVLLVEHRDEVFARLATDMAEFGMRVIRAKSATEALELYDTYDPVLLVGNVDLPAQSDWVMTAKLRLFGHLIHIWLYQCHFTNYGRGIAKFLGADAPLAYHGDLLGLSESILNRMNRSCETYDTARHNGLSAIGLPPEKKSTGREE